MKRKLLFVATLIASALGGNLYAQFDADKTYVISNRNDANVFMQDNGTGIVAAGSLNGNSYWVFEATANTDCYYVKNAVTEKYMQSTKTSGESVATGTTPVEICVKLCSVEGDGMYGFASTDQDTYDFTSGTIGANWDNSRVQGYAATAGTNHKSFWKVVEQAIPEPEPEPDPVEINSPWDGNEVASGDFYLYNVESGLWLQNNDSKANDWSTRAAIGTRGLDFAIAGADMSYTLGAKFGRESINPGNNYLDTSNNPAWTFTSIPTTNGKKAYKINCGNKVLGTVRYNEGDKQDNLFTQTGDERWYLENPDNNVDMTERNTWQLVTRAERLAQMEAEASDVNPLDASWLIPSADFANNDSRYNQWTRTLNGGNGRSGDGNGINGSMCIESWNSGSIDFSITIADIPNGTYRMTVQGYYRDGNFDDVMTRRNNGTETIRSYYFAGNVTHPLMSILDEAKDAKVDGAWDRENSGRWYPDSQNSANKCFNLHKGYVNEEIEVIVTTKSLKIGISKSEGVSGDWTVFDNFKLTYLGPIDVSEYLVALNNAISIAESLDTSHTTDALTTTLTNALNYAKSVRESVDTDVLSAATSDLNDAIENVNAVNIDILSQTITLADAEGVDVTEASDFTVNGTSANGLATALNNLRTARKMNALRMPDIYTGSAPAVGKFYLFNVGTGMFLGAGSDWNTHAAVDQVGIEIEFVESGDGYIFKCPWGSFNNSPYVDTGANTVYKFQAVAGKEGVYNILEGSDLLGWNPEGKTDGKKYWNSISNVSGADASDANYQWKVITPAERKALMAAATSVNPVDISYLINNPSLVRKGGYDMWTKTGGSRVSSQDDNNGDRAADFGWEFYDTESLNFSQTLTGLTPGKYEVAVQAFYRDGDGGYQTGVVNNGGELLRLAYLKANEETAYLQNIAYCLDGVPGVGSAVSNHGIFPNWPREAFEYFETGYYWTTVPVTVGYDGILTIGIGKDSKSHNGDWVVLDNFRLKYLGAAPFDYTIGAADYTTFVAPYNIAELPDGVEAFACEVQDNYVALKPVTAIPEGEAVVLKNSGTYTFSPATAAVTLGTDNDLLPSDGSVQGGEGIYALAKKGDPEVIGFYPVASGITVPAGKGYLKVTGGAPIKGYYAIEEDDATGINAIENGQLTIDNAVIFNIAGQRLQKTQKGINIVNGKKVLK